MISMKVVSIFIVAIEIVVSSCCRISAQCADRGTVWRDKVCVLDEIRIGGMFQLGVQGFFEMEGDIHCFVAATVSTA